MTDEAGTLSEGMRAVTISREYGSGGGEIAARLAASLGWRLVDHEVVVRVAGALGVSEAEAATYDEHTEGWIARMLRGLQPLALIGQVATGGVLPGQDDEAQRYQAMLHLVVEGAQREGQAVIVGRGAQVLLADRPDVLHARIVAPLARRVAYVAAREGLTTDEAQARVALKDRDRAHYLQASYHRHPSDPLLYDLIVNTGALGIDDAVDLLALALERKGFQRQLPDEVLHADTTLPRYPGAPGDLRPPLPEAAKDAEPTRQ